MSAAAHGGFAAWLATRPDDLPPPHVVDAEMIFTEVTPPAPPPKVEAEPLPEEPPKAEPPPPAPVLARVVAPRPAMKTEVVPKSDPKTEPPPKTDLPKTDLPKDEPKSDLPRADVPREDVPREDVPRQLVALVPNASLVISVDAGTREVEVVNGGGLHGLDAPKDVVGVLTKETIGRGRVDRGLVHPYYSQLGKALLKNWDADRVAASGLKGLVEQTSANVKLYNEIWADRAAQYGSSGNPLGPEYSPGSNRRAVTNDRVTALTGADLEQRKELAKALKESFRAVRRAIIRVVQDKDGKLLKVELVQPSQDANVDKEALVDVKNAAEKLPPPPAEALEAGKTTLTSLWTFELIVSISPPVPTFSFEFDEALGFIDARLPLDRRIYKKVRLYAVE